jgi:hypothetical protein
MSFLRALWIFVCVVVSLGVLFGLGMAVLALLAMASAG